MQGQIAVLGENHSDVFDTMNNYAGLLERKGDLVNAEALYRRALEGRIRALGPQHPDTWSVMSNLSDLLYTRDGPTHESRLLLQKALEMAIETVGEDHSITQNFAVGWNQRFA
mmetsp:Transcript_7429/g.15501  ORF Transcript_7429/g.15501 Transcript_7429/m.15501 type:complete len:113 (-) Transcript_7429:69-407(-)